MLFRLIINFIKTKSTTLSSIFSFNLCSSASTFNLHHPHYSFLTVEYIHFSFLLACWLSCQVAAGNAAKMGLNNDTRGWIMTCVSGVGKIWEQRELARFSNWTIACVFGSSIICVDLIIQHIPGKRNFRIQDSNVFLSSSLSLSFGVMVRPT